MVNCWCIPMAVLFLFSFLFFLINSFYGSLKKAKLEIISRKPVRIMMIDRLVSSVEKCCLMMKKKCVYHNVGKNRVFCTIEIDSIQHTGESFGVEHFLDVVLDDKAANSIKKWNEQQQQKGWMLDVKWILILVSAWQTQIKTIESEMRNLFCGLSWTDININRLYRCQWFMCWATKLGHFHWMWQRETLMELFRV